MNIPPEKETSRDGDMEPTIVDSSCTSHKPLGFQPVNDLQDNSLAKRNSWSQPFQNPGHAYSISSKLKSPSQTSQTPAHSYPVAPKYRSCGEPSQPPAHSYPNSPKRKPHNQSSQPPAHSYPSSLKRNLSNLSSQPPTHSYPVTPSKPSTKISIPTNNLPPTPDTTPTSSQSLKRTYSTALEVRLPAPDSAIVDAASPPQRASKRQHTHTHSGHYDGILEAASPSVRTSKRQYTPIHTRIQPAASQPSSQSPNAATLDAASPSHTYPTKHRPSHLTTAHSLPTPTHSPHRSPFRTDLTPKFSIAYKPPPSTEATISWQELKLVTESILGQVDWEAVAMDVGSNRSARVYKRAVKEVLQERIYEMGSREENGEVGWGRGQHER
ncbi:hypothetical protein N7G274_003359 [Stereocaulon virgatum]|uniref:Myb-like domain-containing protein n=1 Tax=Stereocaulon virgatum TaxID=373712 RepID=A0ABR4AEG2_9LECA